MSALWLVLTLLPLLGAAERFSCRGRILGAYYADSRSGCKAFHVCVRVAGGGIRDFRFFCPPGTLFHQEAQTCTDWGDDDALACSDLYDGQFDLYKIGSGLDTRKLGSQPPREEEPEFHLQRAETGDRRANSANTANNANNANYANSLANDLRAAHSSDFFSGARDRGRDDYTPSAAPAPPSPRPPPRRPATPRPAPPPTTARAAPPHKHDQQPKRKLVRKRPIYVSSTPSPSPFTQGTTKSFPRFEERKAPQPSIPPQFKEYKDEYVEVPRVTPKARQQPFSVTPSFAPTTQADRFTKKEGAVETFSYDAKATAAPQRPVKVRNNFNVAPEAQRQEVPRSQVNVVNNGARTPDYEPTKATANYRSFNSISSEPEKKHYTKKEYYATTPAARSEPPPNLNTVAYNTNIGFDAQPAHYSESDEDDGQYRPSPDEDDGQYRPELYERGPERERERERTHDRERELLAGAHSLNIAASGNRLPDEQKQRKAQTSHPRPFKPAPTPSAASETPAAHRPAPTSRPFDFVQTYTTTSRPEPAPTTTRAPPPRAEPRPSSRAPPPPTIAPAAPKAPHFTHPASNKEDASYDYAYYDSDPGFAEYEHIEEFGKTKGKKA